MAKVNIFNESIIVDNFFNPDVDDEIYKILSLAEENKENCIKSNLGGFQTNPTYNKIICENILKKCVKLITDNYKLIKETNFNLKNLWINKNKNNNFNLPHLHPNSHFSGVYYIKVPNKDGEILFLKDGARSLNGLNDFINAEEFIDSYQIKPKKNMIILFPSSLWHMVKPHFEDGARISVSFNIELNNG